MSTKSLRTQRFHYRHQYEEGREIIPPFAVVRRPQGGWEVFETFGRPTPLKWRSAAFQGSSKFRNANELDSAVEGANSWLSKRKDYYVIVPTGSIFDALG